MQCPKCRAGLVKKKIEGIEVDKCIKCSGIWFDFDELGQIMNKEYQESLTNQVDNNTGDDVIEVPCPRCGGAGKMIPVFDPIKDIHIDTCTVCYGHWLDGGEYGKLKNSSILDIFKSIFKQSGNEKLRTP
ncbi:MAG: zf-TFIIB domain-containing protein [Victivallaceae bacterium]|nr:zf-TFIIB domain-containing protein [Victivallaceae bacterium]